MCSCGVVEAFSGSIAISVNTLMFLDCGSDFVFMFLLTFKVPKVQAETNHLPTLSVLFAKSTSGVDAFLNYIKGLV